MYVKLLLFMWTIVTKSARKAVATATATNANADI